MSRRLNEGARLQLRDAGVSQVSWARRYFTDGKWYGDTCGCPDDRCIGYHHEADEDCGCLASLLSDWTVVADAQHGSRSGA